MHTPLSSIFEAEPIDYSNVTLDELYLSARSSNCLKRSKCKTLGDILSKTIKELKATRNMGLKSINEILSKARLYIQESDHINGLSASFPSDGHNSEPMKNAIELILSGETAPVDVLNDNQIGLLGRIQESIDTIGRDICIEAYTNPRYASLICNSLKVFAAPVLRLHSIVVSVCCAINALPQFIKERSLSCEYLE